VRAALPLLIVAWSLPAAAEEGLFVTRLSVGASAYDATDPSFGVTVNGSADLGLTERLGIVGAAFAQVHSGLTTFGVGLGLEVMVVQTLWHRLYLHGSPALVIEWVHGTKPRFDAAGRVVLGYEYLFMWGFGVVFELQATLPVGIGIDRPFDHAFAGASAGLFMEF